MNERLAWDVASSQAQAIRRGEGDRAETAFVPNMTRRSGIQSTAGSREDWRPIEIRTLGFFEILLRGEPLRFNRKVPKRVLQLLKALIALGGKDVTQERIADALWPESSGDAGINALNTTVGRLRRLLAEPKAVMQTCCRLTLNPHLCCIDAFVFQSLIDGLDKGGTDAQKLQIERALSLYQGAFLDYDQDAPWAVNMRERLRRKFVLAIGQQAQAYELSGDARSAICLYLRGIDADEFAEEFYRGLMRCYEALGCRAEAMSIFRQLRQTLSVTLGIAPSTESQALFDSMQDEQAIDRSQPTMSAPAGQWPDLNWSPKSGRHEELCFDLVEAV